MAETAPEATQTPAQLPNLHVAVLGAGKMGGILLQAFLKQNLFAPEQIHATVAHADKAIARSAQWGVDVSTDNVEAARQADLILVGVKPFQVPDLIAEIKPALTAQKAIISFAASVKTRAIEDAAGIEISVVRAMPNTPSALGAGVAGLCRGRFVKPEQMELAQRIFETVGRSVIVDEKHMDAVTGLSASGPAYIYIIIEALAEAGVKVGLPRDTATQLAAQTVELIVVEIVPTGGGEEAEGNLLGRARRAEAGAAGDHTRDMPVLGPLERHARPAGETRCVHARIVDREALVGIGQHQADGLLHGAHRTIARIVRARHQEAGLLRRRGEALHGHAAARPGVQAIEGGPRAIGCVVRRGEHPIALPWMTTHLD